MRRSRPAVVVVLAVGGIVVLAGCGSASPDRRAVTVEPAASSSAGGGGMRTISASAEGKADGTPDLLTLTIGVQTQAPRAAAALADNNTRAAALIAKLKSEGVTDKDVQTSELSVGPTYSSDKTPVINGYQVSDTVTAKLRKLDVAGQVIDAAAGAGGDATRVQNISFSIDDDSALLVHARTDAVHQATTRAKAMADAAGVKLGQIRSVSDVDVSSSAFPRAAVATGALASSVPLQPGSQQLTVDVEVVWDIA
jgi:uncharacterized protein YggE